MLLGKLLIFLLSHDYQEMDMSFRINTTSVVKFAARFKKDKSRGCFITTLHAQCTWHLCLVKILKWNCINEKDVSFSEVTIKTINVLSSV